MADLQLRIMGEDNASAAFSGVSQAARAAGQIIIDFGKQSVKAYAESERSQRQLQLVAKELTGAFLSQAKAMAEANLVSDELVQSVQTMLLRYGALPKDVEASTQAILDYAAATGTDAKTATEALTRGVESGTGHFKGLGIAIQATGDKTKDLEAAVAALGAKFGGAAGADAASLAGQVRGAEEAFGELQETFGGFITQVASKTGVLAAVTDELRNIAKGAEIASRFLSAGGGGAVLDSVKAVLFGSNEDVAASRVAVNRAAASAMLPEMQGGVNAALERSAIARGKGKGGRTSGGAGGSGAGGGLEGEMYGPQTYAAWANSSGPEGPASPTGEQFSAMAKYAADQQRQASEGHRKALEDMARSTADAAKRLAAQSKEFAQAGASIGAAFTNSITSALEQLASGGEQDAGQILAGILAGVLSTVGSIVGNILLPGVGGAIGGALGGLAGAGVRAAANGPTINVNTFDSRSTREFFEADGGRGFYNAQRTGRGQGGR